LSEYKVAIAGSEAFALLWKNQQLGKLCLLSVGWLYCTACRAVSFLAGSSAPRARLALCSMLAAAAKLACAVCSCCSLHEGGTCVMPLYHREEVNAACRALLE